MSTQLGLLEFTDNPVKHLWWSFFAKAVFNGFESLTISQKGESSQETQDV